MVEARDSVRQRHANRSGSQTEVKRACVCVQVNELDYMRSECKSEGTYMPNTCKKINHFVDSGLEVHVRCGEWKRQLCVKNKTKNEIP